jgi:hypothetical protein
MQSRLVVLKRLVALYGIVEEMHSVELQRMTAAVRETQVAIGIQQNVALSARLDGRDALMTGDRMGWTMTETQRESAGWRRRRLEQIRVEREVLSDAAKQQYVTSRMKSEQMKRVTEGIAARVEMEEARRAQAVSDDRFLARRRWTDMQYRMHEDSQVNVS